MPIAQTKTTTKTISYSFTNLNCYLNCPHQFYHRYILRDIPFKLTEAMEWGTSCHKAFEDRLSLGKPLPANMQQWEGIAAAVHCTTLRVEAQLAMKQDGSPTDFWDSPFIRGKVDCARLNDLYEPTRAYLFDWKTGRTWEKPFELKIGAMLLKACYPTLEVIGGSYVWLRDNKIGTKHDLSDVKETFEACTAIINKINNSDITNRWDKTPNPLCRFCDVLDCEYNRKEENGV